jgi:hypothetical protein
VLAGALLVLIALLGVGLVDAAVWGETPTSEAALVAQHTEAVVRSALPSKPSLLGILVAVVGLVGVGVAEQSHPRRTVIRMPRSGWRALARRRGPPAPRRSARR